MQHEIIMPALGMSQDTGTLLAWHKSEGEPVSSGEILFEVETDKTTMEVEAPSDGFLVGVSAQAGSEVPVGQVIAYISDSASAPQESSSATEANTTSATEDADQGLPEGRGVIMPTLGMSQDSGLLVSWQKEPGDRVEEDDVLFEVETDKSIAEVLAGYSGYLSARLAAVGDDVPTGQVIAIISEQPAQAPIDRAFKASSVSLPTAPTQETSSVTAAAETPTASQTDTTLLTQASGRVLASPKLRRMAHQAGLDLQLLVDAGVSQPYHARDFAQLQELSRTGSQADFGPAGNQGVTLRACVPSEDFDQFTTWMLTNTDVKSEAQILATFASSAASTPQIVCVKDLTQEQNFAGMQQISATVLTDAPPTLIVRDLRNSFIDATELSPERVPMLSLVKRDGQIRIELVARSSQLSTDDALNLLQKFAERLSAPMRQLI